MRPPDNSLQPTRLACGSGVLNSHSHKVSGPADKSLARTRLASGKLEVPGPPECARMSGPLPGPPGSWPIGLLREARGR